MSHDELAFLKVTKGFNHCFEGRDSWAYMDWSRGARSQKGFEAQKRRREENTTGFVLLSDSKG